MTETVNLEIYQSAFMKEVLRQVKALDTYGVRDGWSAEQHLAPFFRKRSMDMTCVVDNAALARVNTFYQAIAVLIEGECGQMASFISSINEEGFGRVMLIVGKLVVLDKTIRDAGRFGFASPEAMQKEAEKLLAVAVGLIGKYPEVAKI